MCISSPKPPALPENPVDKRQKEADAKEAETKKRLSKRKGGRQFLNEDRGFSGLGSTLLGDGSNKLGIKNKSL